MAILFDPDPERSASHSHMASHLIAPLAAGAADVGLELDGAGVLKMPETTREPLVLAAPSIALDNETLRLHATVTPAAGDPFDLPAVEFGPYTEAGAFLPVHVPGVDEISRTAAPFDIRFSLEHVDSGGTVTALDNAALLGMIHVRLVEGVLGRMIYILGAEKQRLRRQGRELSAMRILERARADALDRMGGALGVLRFGDEITFDAEKREIVTNTRLVDGKPVGEPDEEYRRRLSIYRPFLLSNRSNVLNRLNGPGEDADANAGILAGLGVKDRFALREADNEFAVTMQVFGSGGPQFRDNFFDMLRRNYLLLPEDTEANTAIYSARFVPSANRVQDNALRASLRNGFTLPPGAAFAPALAAALDRLSRTFRTLGGGSGPIEVLRAQDSNRGSRYELGLGADLTPFPSATLDALADAALDANRAPSDDEEVEANLRGAKPQHSIVDPDGVWLFETCGLQTHHRIDPGRIYVSHLPISGLHITVTDGAINGQTGSPVALRADFDAPGEAGSNVILSSGITAGFADWIASGGEALIPLSAEDTSNQFDQIVPTSPVAAGVLAETHLPVVSDPASTVDELRKLPEELFRAFLFGPAMSNAIQNNEAGVSEKLAGLLSALRRHGLVSALMMPNDGGSFLLFTGVIGLPLAGLNLAERRGTGFRWYVVPIQGTGQVKSIGSRSVYVPTGTGLVAVVLIGFARRGAGDPRGSTDPYEVGVDLPDGAVLTVKQYEFLMNYLASICPMGVEINTFNIRQHHVDLDGDGAADALLPSAARTFRQFRRARQRTEAATVLTS